MTAAEWLRSMWSLPIFLLATVVFLNRYPLGLWLRRGERLAPADPSYEPSVSIVIPLFNEGPSIRDTIRSLAAQDYPADKLEVIVVDDCSTDDSHAWACRAARQWRQVRVLRNPHNMGKRKGINHAVREARGEIIVSVDSDVLVDRGAVRALVTRFVAPDIAAVGGRVHVSNANENWLSRMQTIKYFFGQEYLKNLERAFDSVLCLSGCLTAYRRHVLIALEPILENRGVLGVPIKYGEDRFLTRQIVKHGWRTRVTFDAFCYTKAPTTLSGYFNQQLRWKRSNLIDYFCGMGHAWRLHPVVGVHYMAMFALTLVYPLLLLHAVVTGQFLQLLTVHLGLLALLGVIYQLSPAQRLLRPEHRVHPLWFLPLGVLLPAAYLVLTPLGLFTLDSSSWETRGAPAPGGAPR